MKKTGAVCCFLLMVVLQVAAQKTSVSLAGIWKFKLDPFATGISSNGVQMMPSLTEAITLPGSTDQAGKGIKTQEMTSLRLTRLFEYKGAAWYEKEVSVPEEWKDKELRLFLERAHWETTVWVNGKPAGSQESLSVPHIYDLTELLQPGKKNTIRIRVDNNMIYNIEYSHAVSAETQTNWNGIIGKIELQAFDKIHIADVQVFPDIKTKTAKCRITVLNKTKLPLRGTVRIDEGKAIEFSGSDSLIEVEGEWSRENAQYWDEFHPTLYKAEITLQAEQNRKRYNNTKTVEFGLKEWSTSGTRFTINARPVFIRGTVNCAEFPLTAYPAMDTAQWSHIFNTCKAYGLNLVRFHSWCPPEAAFVAADRIGIYLQVENSDWRFTIGKDSSVNRFLTEEADRILKTYGNHPSFAMFCEGNELVGPSVNEFLSTLVKRWKKDSRHLYSGSSGYPIITENHFHDYYGARPQRWKEGLKGRFNAQPLNTKYDYSDYVAKFDIPMITHEIGQWCVYPDFNEISKYIGVLKPFNYELFRESLRGRHMEDMAEKFMMASGKFQVIQKKEEIESYLRTPGFGGYHLLQLNDFPGQGTAPVGVVDVFYDPKPYVTAKEFSRFQSALVPLLRTSSFTWTNDQHFTADIEFANFGEKPLAAVTVTWALRYPDGKICRQGNMAKVTIPLGSPIKLGSLDIALNDILHATRLILTVQVPGMDCSNQWSIWVYPKQLPEVQLQQTIIANNWSEEIKQQLLSGARVLLLADTSAILSDAEPAFSGISWNTVWSGMPPNLLGILCDPAHVALKYFPTEFHSNWQWWDLVRHSKPLVLDHTPGSFRPLVQMIPDWNKNNKIGLIIEAKVGKGRLLISAIDLKNNLSERPVARQMLYSLQQYINSNDFAPKDELGVEMIDILFKNNKHGSATRRVGHPASEPLKY
jgi:hypothetical protein